MIKEAIAKLVSGYSLTEDEASRSMEEIMDGNATPAQMGAFMTALRVKGETVDEIVGLAKIVRARAVSVSVDRPVVDTAGTGGDGLHTFNISTAAAFIAAGAGLMVAKHGGRAASSRCGSADVLEELGVKIDLDAGQVKRCLDEVGIAFMFAPLYHPAFKYAAAPRQEIGIRTIFNVLGPLTNPACARAHLLGVADKVLAEKLAQVLQRFGETHTLVVHGDDGLDEVTITGLSQVYEVVDGRMTSYTVSPEDFGMGRAALEDLRGGSTVENAALLRGVLSGKPGPCREVALLNAAAAIVAGDKAVNLYEGLEIARESIDSGRALARLEALISYSRSISQKN